jgi:hypothetical protein
MKRRALAAIVLALTAMGPLVLQAQPASAFPPGDSVFGFNYRVVATAHIKRQDLTMSPPPGVFKGAIDLDTGQLKGKITIPPATFTQAVGGPLGVTATAAMESVKPVTGHIDLNTFKVTSTSVVNIHILTMYPSVATPPLPLPIPISIQPLPQVNLVGNNCKTSTPVKITISGIAHIGMKSKFSGTFTIPDFANCQAMTTVLNQEIPGPGNTFSAVASPL